ncbi:glycosyltransferase family 2 protein [Rhizobium sp. FY34]|uniref:glycosyltransferase family 2 protein n=1 Tax=Rhizobium sp. FY34 TaxID=2562309 RepID=UPI001FED9747|nr:glycosyltransferase family 2 protein [Rhizobium sp. FY34]
MTDLGEYPPTDAIPGLGRRNSKDEAPEKPVPDDTAHATEIAALRALGLSKPLLAWLCTRAHRNGTTIETELLASGRVREEAYFGALARAFRLPFVARIDPAAVQDLEGLDIQLQRPTQIRLNHKARAPQVAIVPEAARLAEFSALLMRLPDLGRGLVITTPGAIRRAVWAAGARRRVRHTVSELFDNQPQHSARIVATGRQGMISGMLLTLLAAAIFWVPGALLPLMHAVISLLYLSSLVLRILAVILHKVRKPKPVPPPEAPLACYTVMVALYREANMAPQLTESLMRLDWPRSRLDIKLVCEADDRETIEAFQALNLPPHFEIVEVPPYHPRTKPKALSYALPAARGDYLAVYDAEDRPHPQQLMEACQRFRQCGPDVACLQAPLVIANMQESHVSTLFAVEYAALFRGLLPMLSRYRMPMPLGGTSNHFRTDVLRKVGGWDPYNVTEDADLGLRLYRLGYRSETLRCQTLEDAPVSMKVWTDQRRRWFKGWLQTWLVMTRHPLTTMRQMGLRATLVFHLLIGGMLISALGHPLILLFFGSTLLTLATTPVATIPLLKLSLFAIDTVNVFGSYATFLALGIGSMIEREKRMVGWRWIGVPLHWFMSSYAAWRALNELRTNPFFWKKTPHNPSPPKKEQ